MIDQADRPEIRFDVVIGVNWPHRVMQRATREQANAYAAERGQRIDWNTAHMLGNTTAEVTMVRN